LYYGNAFSPQETLARFDEVNLNIFDSGHAIIDVIDRTPSYEFPIR
jgi:hypothetical protein